jgi:hypothetical protein
MKKGHMKLKHLAVLFMVYLAVGICVYSACYRNAWGICLRPGDGIKVIPPEPYPCAGEAVIIAVSTYAVGDIVEDVPPGGIGYTKKMYGGWCGPFLSAVRQCPFSCNGLPHLWCPRLSFSCSATRNPVCIPSPISQSADENCQPDPI